MGNKRAAEMRPVLLLRKLAKESPAKLLVEIPATYGVTVTLNPVAGPGKAKGTIADASFE